MTNISPLEWEVLNATADDWENLEQIHELVRQAPSLGNGKQVTLSQTADAVRALVTQGSLSCKDENGASITDHHDASYVWRGWFTMTDEGRRHWQESALTASAKR